MPDLISRIGRRLAAGASYDRFAGCSVERLAALSDGVFAAAMTLLVLDLRVPVEEAIHGETDLWRALLASAPRFLMHLMSFLTLGIFWIGQQAQLSHLSRSDRHLTWIHIAFLATISVLPFSTMLLAVYPLYHVARLTYWVNLLLLGIALYASWGYAIGRALLKDDVPPEAPAAVCRRIKIAQALYAFGVLLSIFGTYWSIGFIVFVQLNYAIAPRYNGRHDPTHSP